MEPTHWTNHPKFYNHPLIAKLSPDERWTANAALTGKGKMPIALDKFIYEQRIAGCDMHGPPALAALPFIQEHLPTVNHHTYWLENPRTGYMCLDVEPDCPQDLKDRFLRVDYVYGEKSLSGKGYHLWLPYPADLMAKYPAATTKTQIKHPNKWFEFLLDRHFVTFTRNMLPPASGHEDISDVMDALWAAAKTSKVNQIAGLSLERPQIPEYDRLMHLLRQATCRRTLEDCGGDESKYDFTLGVFYYNRFLDVVGGSGDFAHKGYVYTDAEILWVVYDLLSEIRPDRDEEKGPHSGMPWLMFQVSRVIAKTADRPAEDEIRLRWKRLMGR